MIEFDKNKKVFHLCNGRISYVIGVNDYGYLENLYFGEAVSFERFLPENRNSCRGHSVGVATYDGGFLSLNEFPSEYPTYGLGDFREPALAVSYSNGSRITDLKFQSFEKKEKDVSSVLPKCNGGETLAISLYDGVSKLKVELFYTVYDDSDAITRSCVIENLSETDVLIDKCMSFGIDIKNNGYQKVILQGAHLRERYVERTDISHGIFKIDSKRGVSSAQLNPFIAICDKNADEDAGDVYGFSLIYSGSYELYVQRDENDVLRIGGGINSFDFSWKLKSKEKFETPEAVLVYSKDGFGVMSRQFHDLYRNHLINPKYVFESRPIVINNWEATYFDFDEEKLKAIVDSVKESGIDMLVLDDGWFGERNNDRTSLGDWFVNVGKLPSGLKPISEYCHKNGLKFGLWFEPEMISKNSELFNLHSDWAISVPERTPCEGRHQYVLDITREDVREYVKNTITKIVVENGVDYIKWDMNRSVTENFSANLPSDRQKEFSHRYVLGLYELLDYFDKRLPNVIIEGCASGGCRFDAGILRYCPQIWTSDNSDAYSRTIIQYGTSFCYPLSSMSCHVSVCPNHQTGRVTPFESRNDIASLGAFGYELDVTKSSEEEMNVIKDKTKEYRQDENLILYGDLYRLNSMRSDNVFAQQIVSKDKTESKIVVMVGQVSPNDKKAVVYPKGLKEEFVYEIKELDCSLTGNAIMTRGLNVPVPNCDYKTFVFHLSKA